MKLLCHLVHPAHFHFFIPIVKTLQSRGWDVFITIRNKDVLERLLIESNYDFINISANYNSINKISVIFSLLSRTLNLIKKCKEFKPDIIISSAPEVAITGRILNISSLLFFEDDLEQVKLWAYITGPLASTLLCPESCSAYKWEHKAVKYNGYHELTYLSPNFYQYNNQSCIKDSRLKILIRLASLNAYHDTKNSGIVDSLAAGLINSLSERGTVFITAERELPKEFEKFRVNIKPSEMLEFLSKIDLYIGDSQTMAAEAAVLGTPSIRFNDFVGKLGYLEELEHKYGLTYGIKTSEPEKLFQKIDELLSMPNLKEEWQSRREKMLSDKIDVTAFMVWFIENYPKSVRVMRENPDYQYKFK